MNEAILMLTENGKLQQIRDKWWNADLCPKKLSTDADPDYVFWFYLFVGCGCFVALIMAVVEYLIRILQSK